jgi:hypothetical protein
MQDNVEMTKPMIMEDGSLLNCKCWMSWNPWNYIIYHTGQIDLDYCLGLIHSCEDVFFLGWVRGLAQVSGSVWYEFCKLILYFNCWLMEKP